MTIIIQFFYQYARRYHLLLTFAFIKDKFICKHLKLQILINMRNHFDFDFISSKTFRHDIINIKQNLNNVNFEPNNRENKYGNENLFFI